MVGPIYSEGRLAIAAGQVTVTGVDTATQLTAQEVPPSYKVVVKALSTNSATVFTGPDNSVTTSNGFELSAGEAVHYFVRNVNQIWFVSGTASQKISWTVEA